MASLHADRAKRAARAAMRSALRRHAYAAMDGHRNSVAGRAAVCISARKKIAAECPFNRRLRGEEFTRENRAEECCLRDDIATLRNQARGNRDFSP